MDIEERLNIAFRVGTSAIVNMTEVKKKTREFVVEVLQEVVDSGHELGGMGEYGKGWNDARTQVRIKVKEMKEKWQNRE